MKTLLVGIATVFLSAGVAYAKVSQSDLQFDKLDTNNDGLVSQQELNAHPKLDRNLKLNDQTRFNEADFNGDGILNRHEFNEYARYFLKE